METNFNFKSAICTSRVQSERLLSLGLKKETADMRYAEYYIGDNFDGPYKQWQLDICPPLLDQDIPAWSLHRLICMYQHEGDEDVYLRLRLVFSYDDIIDQIEYDIKEGYFNKEYLENEMA